MRARPSTARAGVRIRLSGCALGGNWTCLERVARLRDVHGTGELGSRFLASFEQPGRIDGREVGEHQRTGPSGLCRRAASIALR
jgi:hypothetical protein